MVPSQGSGPDLESVRAVILVIAVGAAIFWREVLRMLLALLALAIVVGVFMLMGGMHG
jgi:hypothetical protein